MYKNRSRGFTLIELLVVIAIIGILSAVVLASLNTARTKGSDAAIKANLDTIRTQSAIVYDGANNYGTNGSAIAVGICTAANTANTMFVTDANVKQALSAADVAAGGTAGTISKTSCAMAASGGAWAVWTPLAGAGASNGWCVDSTGASKVDTIIVATACP